MKKKFLVASLLILPCMADAITCMCIKDESFNIGNIHVEYVITSVYDSSTNCGDPNGVKNSSGMVITQIGQLTNVQDYSGNTAFQICNP